MLGLPAVRPESGGGGGAGGGGGVAQDGRHGQRLSPVRVLVRASAALLSRSGVSNAGVSLQKIDLENKNNGKL